MYQIGCVLHPQVHPQVHPQFHMHRSVFGDVFTVLRTAIEHHVQASARDQVLLLYLQAVEPYFGLGERREETAHLRTKVGIC